MSNGNTISIIGTQETTAVTRSGRSSQVDRVSSEVSIDTLRNKFSEFMTSLEEAFAVDAIQTATGAFELTEIQFSAELSASGDFKLLGTGVGVSAGSALAFVLRRKSQPPATS